MTPLVIEKGSDLSYGQGLYVNALLIGPGGGGKTTGAATFPGRKLFIDCDQGKEALLGAPNVDFISIPEMDINSPRAWMTLKEVKKEIKAQVDKGTFPYDVVILDSVTRAYEIAMNYAMLVDSGRNAGGTPLSTHWMVQKKECAEILEYFINAPLHFIATVHEVADKDDITGALTYQPAITGKDAERITRRFREIYHCFATPIKDDKGVEKAKFQWRTSPTVQRPYLKSTLNTGQRYWGALVEPSFEKLIALRGIKLTLKEREEKK